MSKMWIDRLWASRTTDAVRLAARFTEQRHKLLADNIANIDTPDYRARRLDREVFRGALKDALDNAKRSGSKVLKLRGNGQVSTDAAGQLHVRPRELPPPNILFHDGTNARLERLVTDMQENAMSYRLAINLLRGRFNGLMTAIRGRIQ